MSKSINHRNQHFGKTLKRAKKYLDLELGKAITEEEKELAYERYRLACEIAVQNEYAVNW